MFKSHRNQSTDSITLLILWIASKWHRHYDQKCYIKWKMNLIQILVQSSMSKNSPVQNSSNKTEYMILIKCQIILSALNPNGARAFRVFIHKFSFLRLKAYIFVNQRYRDILQEVATNFMCTYKWNHEPRWKTVFASQLMYKILNIIFNYNMTKTVQRVIVCNQIWNSFRHLRFFNFSENLTFFIPSSIMFSK